MARLIDADELADKILSASCFDCRSASLFLDMVDSMPTVTSMERTDKAIRRMWSFGRRFLDNASDPRGPIGEPGNCTIEEQLLIEKPIQDVDGNVWRPVLEEVFQQLLCLLRSAEQPCSQNSPLLCDGCVYHGLPAVRCAYCTRSKLKSDHYRLPQNKEDT